MSRTIWLAIVPVLLFTNLVFASYMPVKRLALAPSLVGSPVDFGPGTYPRATQLSDGSLLGAYTRVENGTNIISTVISTDNGVSWQPQGEITRGVGDIDNAFLLQLQSGRVLTAFRNHSKDPATGAYTFYRITICFSDDGGRSWAYLSQPASDPAGPNGNWEPFMRLSNAGVLQLYYSRENNAGDQDSLMRTSPDGGASWTSASVITGAELPANRDGMLGLAQCAPGAPLVAVFETVPAGGTFSVWSVRSLDDGATWGDRRQVFQPGGDGTNAGAPQIACVGGALVASFMTDEDTAARDWPNGAAMKVLTSDDDGLSWGHKTTVFSAPAYWPGLLALDGSNFLALADSGGAKAQHVTLV